MTNKITLYRLKGKMPEKKKCDWQGTNATTSEVTGYNQAIDDISSKLEKVDEEKLRNFLGDLMVKENRRTNEMKFTKKERTTV